MAHEILEQLDPPENIVLVGIKRRGVPLAQRLAALIERFEGVRVPVGDLDITLYRDDLTTLYDQPQLKGASLPVDINGKLVVLVDDVIYTGRTVRAALDALVDQGRHGSHLFGGAGGPRPPRAAHPRRFRRKERSHRPQRAHCRPRHRNRRRRQRRPLQVRGSDPQPQSSSLALPCQILVSVDGCRSLTAFGGCAHWARASSRRP